MCVAFQLFSLFRLGRILFAYWHTRGQETAIGSPRMVGTTRQLGEDETTTSNTGVASASGMQTVEVDTGPDSANFMGRTGHEVKGGAGERGQRDHPTTE